MRFRGRQLQFQQWQAELESTVKFQQQTGFAGACRQMDASVFSFENLYRAYLKCRKNKRRSKKALEFEINAEENLLKLKVALQSRTYRPLPSTCFVTESPKMREIFAADSRDRVVHAESEWKRNPEGFLYSSRYTIVLCLDQQADSL
jgi:hypothetical protein